jgi:hypothetical protein
MSVELVRARIEYIVEDKLPEYAYAKDLSVFVGKLFNLIVVSEDFMMESYNLFTELAHEMTLYSDLGEPEIKDLLSHCLDVAMNTMRDYRLLRNAEWQWMTYQRNEIVIIGGE